MGPRSMISIEPLSTVAPADVEHLLDAAFGADRKARTAYKLREGVPAFPALSFGAFDEGKLAGTLQSWPVVLEGAHGLVSLTLVGPVAVLPSEQGAGVGQLLMERLMLAAHEQGHDALTMIGDPEYYGRFWGFSPEWTQGWELPGPFERRRLLAYVTRPEGLPRKGRVIPDPAFASADLTA